jgi:hypothetical protein
MATNSIVPFQGPASLSLAAIDKKRRQLEADRRTGEQLRDILDGARQFIDHLQRDHDLLGRTRAALIKTGPQYQRRQLEELNAAEAELLLIRDDAKKIVKSLEASQTIDHYTAESLSAFKKKFIVPLIHRENARRVRNMRVQGRLVPSEGKPAPRCGRQLAEAVKFTIDYFNKVVADPYSGLSSLWRFITAGDNAIWLYHHDTERKWQCLFFRIDLTRSGQDLHFNIESYVPFGVGGDPADYEMETSSAYTRPGWSLAETVSATFNSANTLNLNTTDTHSTGKTLGQSLSLTASDAVNTSTSNQTGAGFSQTTGTSKNTSWFENMSDTSGHGTSYSSTSGMNYSSTSGSSSNRSTTRGQGMGGGTALTQSSGLTENKSVTDTSGNTKTSGTATTTNAQNNVSDSTAKSRGISATTGESLQVSVIGFGMASSKSNKDHLVKWKEKNTDAARIYDAVHRAFNSMTDEIVETLQRRAQGSFDVDERELDERRDEIFSTILVENDYVATRKNVVGTGASSQPVRAIPQARGVSMPDPAAARARQAQPLPNISGIDPSRLT